MSDRQVTDRAMTLAEMAPHHSVTVGVLCGQEGQFPDSRTCRAPVSYLEDTEAPAYVLTNSKRGIGLGTKRNTTSPVDDRGAVALVTGRRTLCLVGGAGEAEDGDVGGTEDADGGGGTDEVIEIPHASVSEVTYRSGFLRSRFVLKTPWRQYHVWVPRDTDESTLAAAAEYVGERMHDDPEELETDDGANTLTYRGQPVSPENHPGIQTGGREDDVDTDLSAVDSSDSGSERQPLTYRGREVSPENHPGVRTNSDGTSADEEHD
jgi:hypothetical protein